MYLHHFGFSDYPFRLTPDTGFFFNSVPHRDALNMLLVAVRANEGFVLLTGEVGTGKTLLCRQLLAELERDFCTAWIPNPHLNANGVRQALAEELGLDPARNLGQHRLLSMINRRLLEQTEAGRPVVVVLDECQSMPDDALEALRLLTNLETERSRLLQVVMFAQPELEQRLAQHRLRQLRQRITFHHRLEPLAADAVEDYLEFRVIRAGHGGEPLFDGGAVRAIVRGSRGIPRLVNVLAHKALLVAYGRGSHRVNRSCVGRAVRDTDDATSSNARSPAVWAMGAVAVLMLLGFGAYLQGMPVP
ncbi:MAG: AAA family ATPase [Aquisalimonadaceae bacterium]